MQIGFKQDSYAVRESDGTVTVCVNSTTRTFNVPVTLETLDTGTAQGMCSYCFQYSLVIIYQYMLRCIKAWEVWPRFYKALM